MNNFMKNAAGLTKNPLGIIALFISLIYGFACIVLSTSLSNMITQDERLPLIWFIILFPILILLAFIFLVVNHHEKLYSPGDFREDNSFIRALNGKRIKRKQKKEAKILEDAETVTDKENSIEDEENQPSKEEVQEQTQSESQDTTNNKNTKTTELSIIEDNESLVNKFSNSENWVATELSLKYNMAFKTNQIIATKYGQFELDAIGNDNNRAIIAEVKYWESNKSIKPLKITIQDFLRKYQKLETLFGINKEFKIIIALVFDNLENINRRELSIFVNEINKNVIVEFYDYRELKKENQE